MSLVWALAAARTAADVVGRVVWATSSGRYTAWDALADWATDGDYSHQKAAAAAGRTRVAHLEADVRALQGEKALLHLKAGTP